MKFWDNVVSNAVSQLSLSCSLPEILALKIVIESRSRREQVVLVPHFFWGGDDIQKSLSNVLLPTDTRHVLKFRKDSFRDVDGIDSKR